MGHRHPCILKLPRWFQCADEFWNHNYRIKSELEIPLFPHGWLRQSQVWNFNQVVPGCREQMRILCGGVYFPPGPQISSINKTSNSISSIRSLWLRTRGGIKDNRHKPTKTWRLQIVKVLGTDSKTMFPVLKGKKRGFPGGAVVKNLPADAGDTGSSPGAGRSHMPRSN